MERKERSHVYVAKSINRRGNRSVDQNCRTLREASIRPKNASRKKTGTHLVALAALTSKTNMPEEQNNGIDGPFGHALECCRAVAREEFPLAMAALKQAETLALTLVDHLTRLADGARAAGVVAVERTLKELEVRMREEGDAILKRARSGLAAKRQRLNKFTIALFGQTMTGKSTFREAIMADNGKTIGSGSQNTTQTAHEYEWNGLHIIDTPGFGAPGGRNFQERAVRVVGKCDLVIFFVTDDNVPLEAREGMKEVLRENKKVFFVLNMKKGLEDEHDRRRFLERSERLFDSDKLHGHHERIRTLAHDWLGMRDEVRVFPIHAKAAHLATQAEDPKEREALDTASRLEELRGAFREEVSRHDPIRRLQTLIDGTVRQSRRAGNATCD